MHILSHLDTILISIGILGYCIFQIIFHKEIHKMRQDLDRFSILLYQLHRNHDTSLDTLHDVDDITKQLHEGFHILEVAYKKVYGEKRMPTPQEAQQIESTIRDLLSIEIVLSQDMPLPRRESFNNVILSTIRTYPNIHEEYLIKKATSIFTNFIKSDQ
jgi:hypothetical protein